MLRVLTLLDVEPIVRTNMADILELNVLFLGCFFLLHIPSSRWT